MARPAPPDKEGREREDGTRRGESQWGEGLALRPLSFLVLDLIRPVLDRHGRRLLRLKTEWPVIAGEREARLSSPRGLRQGTLTLSVAPAIALELQHRSAELIARINAHLGEAAVTRLRLVQDHPGRPAPATPPSPLPPTPSRSAPPFPAPLPPALESLPPGEVREALVRLAQALYHQRRT